MKFYTPDVIFFDNAATTFKLKSVVAAYESHWDSTDMPEKDSIAKLINAPVKNVKFTRGNTEALNKIVRAVTNNLEEGDEILLSVAEHHSNIVPWQILAEEKKLNIKYIDINENGLLDDKSFYSLLSDKTKVLSLAHVSNVLGTIQPVAEFAKAAKAKGVCIVIDGAQAVANIKVDVEKIGCDFYTFSGHKMYGPTGVGVLYDKGDVIKEKFNNYPAAYGLVEAAKFILETDVDKTDLVTYTTSKLKDLGVTVFGDVARKIPIISFSVERLHPHDVASYLNEKNIAIRAGHHCAQPLMNKIDRPATNRISFGVYNTIQEVDIFIKELINCMEFFDVK